MNAAEIADRTGLGGETARLLGAYAGLIHKWSRTQSLTSLRSLDAIVVRHMIDVLPLVRALPAGGIRVADIGSGAGVPGIPAAICRPDAHVTLVEKRRRRSVFLRQCRIELGLTNVEVFHGRSEDWHPDSPPDVLVSRAAAPLERLAHMTAHLFGPATIMLVLKGGDPQEEIGEAAGRLPLAVDGVEPLEAPQSRYMVRLSACA